MVNVFRARTKAHQEGNSGQTLVLKHQIIHISMPTIPVFDTGLGWLTGRQIAGTSCAGYPDDPPHTCGEVWLLPLGVRKLAHVVLRS